MHGSLREVVFQLSLSYILEPNSASTVVHFNFHPFCNPRKLSLDSYRNAAHDSNIQMVGENSQGNGSFLEELELSV